MSTRSRALCPPPPLHDQPKPSPHQLVPHGVSPTLRPRSLPSSSTLKVLRHVSPEGKDLVRRLLARNPEDRPSAQQVLSHPWLRAVVNRSKATTASSHRLIRRKQQQHRRHTKPVEGTWGVTPPRPPPRPSAGVEVAEEEEEKVAAAAAAQQRSATAAAARRRQRQAITVRHEDAVEGGEGAGATAGPPGLAEAAAVVASVAGDHLSEMI